MLRRSPFAFLALLCLSALNTQCFAVSGEFLPASREIFQPLEADPRELQYAVRLAIPVSYRLLGEAAIGDYLGFYRWSAMGGDFQISAGGGFFGRFDLASKSNDMQSSDFYANLPLDYRNGKWSSRFMLYHNSAHLGDDLIRERSIVPVKHSWDNIRWLVSHQLRTPLRVYGGYTYAFRTLPQSLGRSALQAGFEYRSLWPGGNAFESYWANDFQSWERSGWHPAFNSQLGITAVKNPRAMTLFLEYSAGGLPQGQFYRQTESRWGIGVKFKLT